MTRLTNISDHEFPVLDGSIFVSLQLREKHRNSLGCRVSLEPGLNLLSQRFLNLTLCLPDPGLRVCLISGTRPQILGVIIPARRSATLQTLLNSTNLDFRKKKTLQLTPVIRRFPSLTIQRGRRFGRVCTFTEVSSKYWQVVT